MNRSSRTGRKQTQRNADGDQLTKLLGRIRKNSGSPMDEHRAEPNLASAPSVLSRVRKIVNARRLRGQHFPPEIFGEPAWDILLDLYASHLAETRVSVTSVSLGSGTPATTALRWMKVLDQRGFIQRRPDPLDGRRIFIELSLTGIEAMDALFSSLPPDEPLL